MAERVATLFGTKASPAIQISIDGDKASFALSRFTDGIKDWTPFWRGYFAPQFFADVQANFGAGGAYSEDGGWKPLTPLYAARKARTHPGRPIMVRDGDLKTSLLWRGSLYSETGGSIGYKGVARFTPESAELGSSVPYALAHQRGVPSRNLPRRRILFLPTGSSATYGKLTHQWAYSRAKLAKAAE